MTAQPPPDPDERLAALARDIERAQRAVGALTARADQAEAQAEQAKTERAGILAQLGDLAAAFDMLARPPGPPRGSWLLPLPPGPPDGPPGPTRADMLDDLIEWLARVYLRFPGAALPSCWAWHPAVVEELLWLRRAHHDAYSIRHGSSEKVGAWHDRFRPGVVKRIDLYVGDCELPRHCAYGDRHRSGLPEVPLARFRDVLAAVWETGGEAPEPTPPMLDEAAAMLDVQI